ncbi:MAG: EscU/YscU/HrcU family type III secretion system export apparatus switch protein [Deltaproteobacteria bacterium]|nr:EscU/YscU/HrcU family type III secretion system export apparatus switch protein [Deltaproteobacteria bacterium]
MAEGQESSQEKTEEATPRRVREARKKGQVARSRDLNTIVILIAAFGAVALLLHYIGEQLLLVTQQAILVARSSTIEDRELFRHLHAASYLFAKTMAPYLGIVLFVALAIGFLQIGPIFSAETIKMQAKRLNIVENVKNMAKVKTLIELLKNAAKMLLVFLIAFFTIRGRIGEVLQTMTATPAQAAAVAVDVLTTFLFWVFICFVVIAIIDVFVERWNYKKQLRMSKDEVKREYKQDEGDPLIKQTRRELHRELAMGDVRSAVAASDMVVTNPTELAIALAYNDQNMAAPQIMLKGERLFAQTIRNVAHEMGIPIMQNVPLAWALIELKVGDEIPEELYTAVAELLLIVYRMREGTSTTPIT